MRTAVMALLAVAGSAALAQDPAATDSIDAAKQLTVMINATMDGDTRPGAGIIFGVANNQIYIATANHLVRRGLSKASDIQVEFHWLPGQPVSAQLLTYYDDRALDLAVLVADRAAARVDPADLRLDRLGDPSMLSRDSGVSAIGYPNGTAFDVSSAQVSQVEAILVKYRVLGLVPGGYSGGPLVDRSGMIVGMVRQDQPPNGEATRIGLVVDQLKAWNYQVALRGPSGSQTTPVARSPGTQSPVQAERSEPAPLAGATDGFQKTLLQIIADAPNGFRSLGVSRTGAAVWKPTISLSDALECHGLFSLDQLRNATIPTIECSMFRSTDRAAALRKVLDIRREIEAVLPVSVWERDERTWSESSETFYMRFLNGPLGVSLVFLSFADHNVIVDIKGVAQ